MTDERSSDPELVLRAEALVAKLSTPEPDWEALATRVSARLAEAAPLDEALLAAPFPEADGESELDRLISPKQTPALAVPALEAPVAEREAVSLADLARATVARRGAREAQNIAKESLAVASQSREQAERVAERVQGMGPRAVANPERSSPAATDSRGPWIGVVIAAVGLAAGFGLYIAGQRRQPELVSVAPPSAALAAPAAKEPAIPQTPAAEAKVVEPAPVAQAFEALPADPADKSAAPQALPSPERAATPAPAVAAKTPVAGRPFGVGVAPERVVLDEDRPAAPAGATSSTRGAKPAETAAMRPAELNQGAGTGDRPSAGAAQAAVGAVLGAARACVAGQAAPSSATLVFASGGQVDRVNVAGPAAGTPAASCIESALKKARVQPFAAESFSLGVTVRPP